RSEMDAELDADALLASRLERLLSESLLDIEGAREGVVRGQEYRHDRVAKRLHHGASPVAHGVGQDAEMFSHERICLRVADFLIERRRALDVGEHDREAFYVDLLGGGKHFR